MSFVKYSLGILFLMCVAIQAELKLSTLLQDHMVLQQQQSLPLWGWDTPGATVTVEFSSQKKSGVADPEGKWSVLLDPMPANATAQKLLIQGSSTIEIQDVLVGEVWICSGQSNTVVPVRNVINNKDEIAQAEFPLIRIFKVELTPSLTPQSQVKGSWGVCSPSTVPAFSAVSYFFARDLFQSLNVPIGIIHSAWGGSSCQAWVSAEAMESVSELKAKKEADLKIYQSNQKTDQPNEASFQIISQNDRGQEPKGFKVQIISTVLFNGMIAPLIPYSVRGTIWYQGESNTRSPDWAKEYKRLFSLMIRDWRQKWGIGDFPFYFVQLANFKVSDRSHQEDSWAVLRQSQLETSLETPQTGMAVIIDLGEAMNVHPKNKQDVGKRLALIARGKTYEEKGIVYQSPYYHSILLEGNKIRVRFETGGSPLTVGNKEGLNAMVETPEKKLEWFEVAGSDQKYEWAEARILSENEVEVFSPTVLDPQYVRYAFTANPEGCNLYNKAGLPASPFRAEIEKKP